MATHTIQAPGEALVIAPVTAVETSKTTMRLLYIDNIRTFLTVLVLLHHVMIIYAGSGSWIYNENRQDLLTEVVGNVFCTINQAFFMGLFLLISAYFVPGAYDRKGAALFWKERLVRLGIPLVIYSWLIHPVFIYWYLLTTQGLKMPWWEFYTRQYFSFGPWIGPGPLWFIETLLIFTLVYAMYRWFARTPPAKQLTQVSFPSNRALVLFALLMGVASFVFRLMFPVDWNFTPLNLQLPFFAQYIAMFIAGLLAYRRGWLENIPETTSRRWLKVAAMLILLYLPGALLGGALENVEPFKGGWHWQSLSYAVWEAYLCVGLCIGLLYLFRKHANLQGRFSASMSRSAYAAYIVQAPVITVVALLVRDLTLHPLLKFGLVGLIAVALCFIIGGFLRRLPYANNVL
jgi:glucan biosynthesis protein C